MYNCMMFPPVFYVQQSLGVRTPFCLCLSYATGLLSTIRKKEKTHRPFSTKKPVFQNMKSKRFLTVKCISFLASERKIAALNPADCKNCNFFGHNNRRLLFWAGWLLAGARRALYNKEKHSVTKEEPPHETNH
ncbi:hypothetical protein SUBVAR_04097 [Subdoligranulum variabile DSM 15176]|uniref:Uncharacterized protein n=1 Tax=Subdoligranulum variabile DSM 15176 TaxID=411471 RepID=D1PID1_9FIRM|nr:hypothetical protein SUBVAR_04097 [Subdoligranulum variabile DSM 15176]